MASTIQEFMDNRITRAIERTKSQAQERLAAGLTTQERLTQLHRDMDMTLGDWMKMQDLKSRAMLQGWITQAEAQTLYALLGESLDTYNGQPLEVKVVVNQTLLELLHKSMGMRGGR